MTMTDKQMAFCREYVKDWNATQAATRAGYSAKTAYSQGQRLLKDAKVRTELSRLTADIANQNDVEVREIMRSERLSPAFGALPLPLRMQGSTIVTGFAPLSFWASTRLYSPSAESTASSPTVHRQTPRSARSGLRKN
ncbi:MAG: terminase small subunit [Planctomycetota bacterium]|jgi:hypothetical protein